MYAAYGAPLLAVGALVGYVAYLKKKREVLCLCIFFLLGYFFFFDVFIFLFVFQLNVQEESAFENPTYRIV